MESLGGIVSNKDYLETIKKIQPETESRTRVDALASKYSKFINLDNEGSEKKLKQFKRAFHVLCHRVARRKSYEQLEDILIWVELKKGIHRLKVFKLLCKQLEGVIKVHI
jgi:hypothetical protein